MTGESIYHAAHDESGAVNEVFGMGGRAWIMNFHMHPRLSLSFSFADCW